MFIKLLNWFLNLFKTTKNQTSPEDIETESYTIEQTQIELEPDEEWDNAEEYLPEPSEDMQQLQTEQQNILRTPQMKYFTIKELIASSTATIKKIDNTPTPEIEAHLEELVINLLDPIRESWGEYCKANKWSPVGITITSGYRCPKLNKAVKGADTSAHMLGYAADTKPSNGKQSAYEQFIRNWITKNPDKKFDQIIIEKSSTSRWVHIGYKNKSGLQRKQCFNLSV